MMKKVCVIINPISGTVSKNILPDKIHEHLQTPLFQTEIVYTQFAGHASELAGKALEDGADYVIAAGGDGTVNEVARVLVNSNAALGIIPVGSGNGLARELGVPMNIGKAIEGIVDAKVISIDYCKANDLVFFCTCGLGFDATVSKRFAEEKTRGLATYLKSAITEYVKYIPEEYEIELDDGTCVCEKAFLLTCANASQYGNNAYIAPDANICDGLMDIALLSPVNLAEAGPMAIQLFTRQLDRNHRFRFFRTRKAIIRRQSEGVMHIDGEPVSAGKEIRVEVVPEGLKTLSLS